MCNPASNYWPGKESRPGETTSLTTPDGSAMNVHVSRAEGQAPATMLVIHDYFDPDDYYFDLADQYAAAGYNAVCPDLFHRQGNLAEQTHAAAGARIAEVGDEAALEDIDFVLEYLEKESLLGPLAITGFCWGGRLAYLAAARRRETRLLVPFYGHLVAWSGPDGPKPYAPLDEAARIDARVVGSYGGGDDAIPVEQVRDMEARLVNKGLSAELKVYAGAPHCFFRTPEWKDASDDAWQRVMDGLRLTFG